MSGHQIGVLERVAYTPEFVNAAKRFGKIDGLRAGFAVARQWIVIALAAAIAIYSKNPWLYVAAFAVIATRQQALASLMHEGAHRRLFDSAAVNDFVANLFCALPIGLSTARYGAEHLQHHRAPNTDDDPYWRVFQKNPRAWSWPKSTAQGWTLLATDFFALNTISSGREIASWTPFVNHFGTKPQPVGLPMVERLQLYGLYPAVVVALYVTHGWLDFALLWLLPLVSLTPVLVRIRAIAEHSALEAQTGNEATRHIDASLFERLTVCPFNINYHLAHHLFPYVTYYNLPKMHALLIANAEFRSAAHVSKTYLGRHGVLRGELMTARQTRS